MSRKIISELFFLLLLFSFICRYGGIRSGVMGRYKVDILTDHGFGNGGCAAWSEIADGREGGVSFGGFPVLKE